MTRHAEVIQITTLDGAQMHTVTIYDPVAQSLADLFLPPEGTQISGEDLEECVRRLTAAANAVRRRPTPTRTQ